MSALRPRHAAIAVIVAVAGVTAGCGGSNISYTPPETTPALTVPKASAADADSTTSKTDTTDTTSTTDTTAQTQATTPAVTATTQTQTTSTTGGATPGGTATTQTTQTTGGAADNSFCSQNPGAC